MTTESRYFIYLVYNSINGKIYIGQHRFRSKQTLDPWYMGSGKSIRNALKKYGESNFQRVILQFCNSGKEADDAEKFWIKKYNPEYNLLEGGHRSGWTEYAKENYPQEYNSRKKKMSERMSGENHPMFGKHHTKETKQKISERHKGLDPWNKGLTGFKMSEECKKKISIANKGKKKPFFTQEHRDKISQSGRGRIPWNKGTIGKMPTPPNKGVSKYDKQAIYEDILNKIPYTEIQKKYHIKSLATITKIKKNMEIRNVK